MGCQVKEAVVRFHQAQATTLALVESVKQQALRGTFKCNKKMLSSDESSSMCAQLSM